VRRPSGNKGNQGVTREYRKPDPRVRNQDLRRSYRTPDRRAVRNTNGVKTHHYKTKYRTLNHHHYRAPRHVHVTWSHRMYREYRIMYPTG
jgi:hypothetical protein